jgi:cysteine-rich repeat protein
MDGTSTSMVIVALVLGGCGRIAFTQEQGPLTCRNATIDPSEQCDDGGPDDGDGCDHDCQVEPGFTCPAIGQPCLAVVGLAGTPGTTLPAVGGGGGADFFHECAQGEVIVGVEAGILDDNLTMVRVACAAVNFALDGALQRTAITLTSIEGNANPNGGQYTTYCPDDAVMVGFRASMGLNPFVGGVQLLCRAVSYVADELALGSVEQSAEIGMLAAGAIAEQCADGSATRAFLGKSGVVLDQMSVRCDTLAIVVCGDGVLTAPEACDDGNTYAGDGCDARCRPE